MPSHIHSRDREGRFNYPSLLHALLRIIYNLVSTVFYSYWLFIGYAERKFGVPSFPC